MRNLRLRQVCGAAAHLPRLARGNRSENAGLQGGRQQQPARAAQQLRHLPERRPRACARTACFKRARSLKVEELTSWHSTCIAQTDCRKTQVRLNAAGLREIKCRKV